MITVFKMLFGKNAKIGNRLADKESFLSFCLLTNGPFSASPLVTITDR
ncbi:MULTISPECIES: hypothetical protein [Enterococcus]|jgi:hypothetical protein|nr:MULTISPECIES: hypothetical protein [Enterococcus]CAG4707482.1 Uncharacterised protein [Enterococcus faecalis]EKQ3346682.1 hypothetical protein [Enterococcus faecium]EKQ3346826.1 hypothetical protein [Enterococcus faecium]EKQ3704541.1 hypothetical protein [Enterococcus faecium]EKQ3704696.1 hypothetical protein [Enterococcus faecium]